MKNKLIIIISILLISTTIADNPLSMTLNQGKNNFIIEENFPVIYASQLLKEYPQIQSISTYQYGQTFGYINTMGGIGTNFLIEPTKDYEIYVNSTTTIYLKS